MTWKMRLIVAAVAAAMVACSATPVDLTEASANNRKRIAKLEKAFRAHISQIDRIRVATELVRLGVQKPLYRAYIADAVDRALAAEDLAAQEWIRQERKDSSKGSQAVGRVARPKHVLVSDRPVQTAPLQLVAVAERPPDPTHLVPIVAASMSAVQGDLEMRARLRRALASQNVLLSAEAALGLAKIKDKESIPGIEGAAKRFDEGFLFASALVYYGDAAADAIAARLLADDELLDEMKTTARSRNFDPYYRR